ncbi:hypothetical protein QQF64_018310 [Cirrhinus molitorella]|uniref:Uncharacterized protein n=1 Tax=Cirrhinus molitorella TaxID=172907 RepID=A0ABR3LFM9_9TELE
MRRKLGSVCWIIDGHKDRNLQALRGTPDSLSNSVGSTSGRPPSPRGASFLLPHAKLSDDAHSQQTGKRT